MAKEEWRLCSGGDLPADVVLKLERLSRIADTLRAMCVEACAELMTVADEHGVREVADEAQRVGLAMGDLAMPVVAAGVAGHC
jgi:hypothetical protein